MDFRLEAYLTHLYESISGRRSHFADVVHFTSPGTVLTDGIGKMPGLYFKTERCRPLMKQSTPLGCSHSHGLFEPISPRDRPARDSASAFSIFSSLRQAGC